MSGTMEQVVVFTAAEKAELQAQPVNAKPLEANEVRGRTIASLISPGTELGAQYVGPKFPAYPGYAGVFEVEEVGSGVTDLKKGDLAYCSGPNGVGGHRSLQRCPREAAIRLPAGLAPEVALHARLMAVSMSTLTTTLARPPDKVLVTGLGPIGHLAAQMFSSCGYRVVAVDPVESRRKLAMEKGIRDVFPAVPLDQKAVVDNIALAVECSAHEAAILDCCKAVRKRGEVVMVGVPRKRRTDIYAFDVLETVFKRYVTLRSGWEWEIARHPTEFRVGSVFGNMAGAVEWLANKRINVDGLYQVLHPRECQQAYQDLLKGRSKTLSVVFDWRKV